MLNFLYPYIMGEIGEKPLPDSDAQLGVTSFAKGRHQRGKAAKPNAPYVNLFLWC